MKNLIIIFVFSFSFTSLLSSASTTSTVLNFTINDQAYVVEKVTDGHGIIWGMSFINKDKIIFTEQNGKIHVLDLSSGSVRELKNVPAVSHSGQGGLLDIALHPKFNENKFVFITYSKKVGSKQTTALARARLDLVKEKFEKWTDLFVAEPAQPASHHYGSRITFDKNDHIYFTVGDRGQPNLAQDLKAHMGKVIRLKTDGSIPQDNPFINTLEAKKEIWSYGHRNPQGIFFDEYTGILYEQEHGPQGGDEINKIEKGKNYGWPAITFGREYSGGPVGRGETHREGMEQPLKYFVPSIAPSSLLIYRHKRLKLFKDRFVSSALALQHLNVIDIKYCKTACEDRLLLTLGERLRSVKMSQEGLIFVSSDNGRIYRISEGVKK